MRLYHFVIVVNKELRLEKCQVPCLPDICPSQVVVKVSCLTLLDFVAQINRDFEQHFELDKPPPLKRPFAPVDDMLPKSSRLSDRKVGTSDMVQDVLTLLWPFSEAPAAAVNDGKLDA